MRGRRGRIHDSLGTRRSADILVQCRWELSPFLSGIPENPNGIPPRSVAEEN
jgi:hypothetical protein